MRVSWTDTTAAKALALLDIEGDYWEMGSGCQDGHKSFLSTDGGVQRLLWFSDAYQDWNFNAGSQAKPVRSPGAVLLSCSSTVSFAAATYEQGVVPCRVRWWHSAATRAWSGACRAQRA